MFKDTELVKNDFERFYKESKDDTSIWQDSMPYYDLDGIGVEPNDKEALDWILKSANKGYLKAQTTLAALGGSAYVLLFIELRSVTTGAQIKYVYTEFLGQVSIFGAGTYAVKSPLSATMSVYLNVGTYNVNIKGYAAYTNSSGTGIGTFQDVNVEGFFSTYQATIG